MSRGYSFLVRRMLAVELRDTETGYKFFRRARALPLLDEIEESGWFWDTEFMVRAVRRGLRVVEVPGAYIGATTRHPPCAACATRFATSPARALPAQAAELA